MIKKIIHIFSLFIIGVGFSIMIYFIALMYYPFNFLEINEHPVKVEEPIYYPGERVEAYVDVCKYTNLVSTTKIELMNGEVRLLTADIPQLPMGCYKNLPISVKLPDSIHPGKYYIEYTVTYNLHIIRKIEYVFRTVDFYIGSQETE